MAIRTRSISTRSIAERLEPLLHGYLGPDLPIRLRAWDGSEVGAEDAEVTAVVHSPEALRHLLWAPGELGLARAHISGSLDIEGDIFALFGLRDHLAERDEEVSVGLGVRGWLEMLDTARRLGVVGRRPALPPEEARIGGLLHSRRRDAAAIGHHYDVGNDFYRLLLGPSLVYSCAYWADPEGGLDAAQHAKCELISRKLGLRPGMRLLDVGCGWGTMALHAASEHGVDVVAVTISHEQAELARRRVADAGLSDAIEIRVQDYRDVHDGPFDAISSIGMFEHVGRERMARYLRDLHRLLRPGGRLLNHAISRPDPNVNGRISPRSFIGRYVFPDGALLEVGTVITAMQELGFEVRDVQSLREHYGRTLRAWVRNLEDEWDRAQRLVGPGRARVWRLYLAGSAIAFEHNRTSIHQVLAVRPHRDGASDMPATRESFEITEPVGPPTGSGGPAQPTS